MRVRNALKWSAALAVLVLSATAAQANGYPSKGKAIDQLKPASNYSDVVEGRPRALGIMRARAQGFVPSSVLHDYVRSVLMKDLRGVTLPASFQPDVRVLASPELSALCTPDGTIVVTIGLLEQLDSEDELAFVLGHEVSHAIYRHHAHDWYKKSQYYMVVSGGAVDSIVKAAAIGAMGGKFAKRLDVAQHLFKLSQNVLAPQMDKDDEDAADALGFDLMVKAGYDSEGPNAVLEKLAQQEEEAKQAAAQAKAAEKDSSGGSSGDAASKVMGGLGALAGLATGHVSSDTIEDLAENVFDAAVDNMAEDSTTHHPAKEREKLLTAYQFREYRSQLPTNAMPLPWKSGSKHPQGAAMATLLTHYSEAETAAGAIAQANGAAAPSAQSAVMKATQTPTTDHAYTQFVASEYYTGQGNEAQSEAALQRAVSGPEPSWEVYSRLLALYIKRSDYQKAQTLMENAVSRFDNSPVLLPRRIEILHGLGRQQEAEALLPQCKGYDISELTDLCKKAAKGG